MATSGIYNARLMLFYVDGVAVAATVTNDLSGTTEEIDTTTKSSSGNYEFLPGLRSATASCGFIHKMGTSYELSDLVTDWLGGTSVNVKVSTGVSGDDYYHGTAYITGWNVSFPNEDKATGDFTIKFTGALSQSTKT